MRTFGRVLCCSRAARELLARRLCAPVSVNFNVFVNALRAKMYGTGRAQAARKRAPLALSVLDTAFPMVKENIMKKPVSILSEVIGLQFVTYKDLKSALVIFCC